jgi:hypothetical protein
MFLICFAHYWGVLLKAACVCLLIHFRKLVLSGLLKSPVTLYQVLHVSRCGCVGYDIV